MKPDEEPMPQRPAPVGSGTQGPHGFPPEQVRAALAQLDPAWRLSVDGSTLQRDFQLKGYARVIHLANLCAWLADQQDHHPDLHLGYGTLRLSLTSHDLGSLSARDLHWACALDAILALGRDRGDGISQPQ